MRASPRKTGSRSVSAGWWVRSALTSSPLFILERPSMTRPSASPLARPLQGLCDWATPGGDSVIHRRYVRAVTEGMPGAPFDDGVLVRGLRWTSEDSGFAVVDAERDGDDIVLVGPIGHLEEGEG